MNGGEIKFQVKRASKGLWEGVITLPVVGKPGVAYKAVGKADSKAMALGKAAAGAKKLLENPLIAAVLPPQAALAVKGLSGISKLVASGKAKDIATKFAGPAVNRLAKALGGLF